MSVNQRLYGKILNNGLDGRRQKQQAPRDSLAAKLRAAESNTHRSANNSSARNADYLTEHDKTAPPINNINDYLKMKAEFERVDSKEGEIEVND